MELLLKYESILLSVLKLSKVSRCDLLVLFKLNKSTSYFSIGLDTCFNEVVTSFI